MVVLGFLRWVVAATMVVVVGKGGCFGFFAVGYGCHGGAVVVLVCGFLVVDRKSVV